MNIQAFRNSGYIYGDLTGQTIEELQELSKKVIDSKEYYHGRSVVNIEEQYKMNLEDIPPSFATFLSSTFQGYEDYFSYLLTQYPQFIVGNNCEGSSPSLTFIDNFRLVCQKSGEYHAPIRHEGTHSFITFLEVPYDFDEETEHSSYKRKLGIEELAIKQSVYPPFSTDTPGSLSFMYNYNGGISTESITIDPYSEGKTFLFPSSTIYYINPFYTSDKPLVYLEGSIGYEPLIMKPKPENEIQDNPKGEENLLENPDKGDEDNFFD